MKKYLDKITFSVAKQKIGNFKVNQKFEDEKFSRSLKLILLCLIAWGISLGSGYSFILLPFISTLLYILLIVYYFSRPKYFREAAYTGSIYFAV
ncbi:hypothetical protein Q2T76_01660 [Lactobacillus sp. YT155]|uniref:hypothetical protein n=1 Tax=Lactobacillus sp. YT155 TaxID=3060955 RepID=UPI00265EBE72|nr:hypothetical protein [Lactobacillus sp. YT155]MDO1604758.1 hypothetical protein [Lactobacillus sp. YT155]